MAQAEAWQGVENKVRNGINTIKPRKQWEMMKRINCAMKSNEKTLKGVKHGQSYLRNVSIR
eukprot:748685-Hanusia_phi.AAC.1